MKRWFVFLPIILIFLLVSCAPSAEKIATQTATAATGFAAAWTKTPTPTLTYTPTLTPTITPTSTMTPTITPTPLGGGPGQIAFNSSTGISLCNIDGTGELPLSENYSMGASFAWSQNGARLAYFTITGLSGPEDQRKYFTCVIDAYTRKEKCFEVGGGRFTLSPDGTKIVVVDGGVNIIDIDSGEKQIWMEDQDVDVLASVDWSPDGTKLAVPSLTGGITIIDVVSGEEYTVVESKEFDYFDSPRWSPDGKKIIYAKRSNIFIVNTDGSDNTLLVKNARNPAWSPDGTQIAYIAFAPGDYYQNNIILMNSDGTNKVKLTPSQYLYGDPMWSSDGNIIVFETFYGSRSNPQFDLYAVEVNSRKLINFTKSYNLDIYTLSPDRRAIYGVGSGGGLVVSLDGTILSEWKDKWCSVGPWRP